MSLEEQLFKQREELASQKSQLLLDQQAVLLVVGELHQSITAINYQNPDLSSYVGAYGDYIDDGSLSSPINALNTIGKIICSVSFPD